MFSLIIPTYNEHKNIIPLIFKIRDALNSQPYEIIIIDDNSPDGTWQLVEEMTVQDSRVRLIKRFGERGLSSSVLKGFEQARGHMLAVMDADFSHDVEVLPRMLQLMHTDSLDCIIASRYIKGAEIQNWPLSRKLYSFLATRFASAIVGVRVSDPLSGFFCISKVFYDQCRSQLKPRGYKILLELLAKGQPKKLLELPYVFQNRRAGKSKLSLGVIFDFLFQIAGLAVYRLFRGYSDGCH